MGGEVVERLSREDEAARRAPLLVSLDFVM